MNLEQNRELIMSHLVDILNGKNTKELAVEIIAEAFIYLSPASTYSIEKALDFGIDEWIK